MVSKRVIVRVLVLPLLAGLLVTSAAYFVLRRLAPPPAEPVTVAVAMARRDLAPRTVLTPELIETRRVDPAFVQGLDLISAEDAVGQRVVAAIAAGEVLLRRKLAVPGTETSLAFRIPPGRRAVTVRVDAWSGVAGFVRPGDQVDVLYVFGGDSSQPPQARVLIEAAPVLAVGLATTPGATDPGDVPAAAKRDGGEVAAAVTLALTVDEAVRLGLGAETGTLRLALRPVVGEERVGQRSLRLPALLGGD